MTSHLLHEHAYLRVLHVGLSKTILENGLQLPSAQAGGLDWTKQRERDGSFVGNANRAIQIGCFEDGNFQQIFWANLIIARGGVQPWRFRLPG